MPCLKELAEFTQRADELRAARIDVVALSVDRMSGNEDHQEAEVMSRIKFPFAWGHAPKGLVSVLQTYHDYYLPLQTPLPLPTSVLIDGDHQLSAIFKGRVDVDQLLALPLEATKDTGEALRQTAMFPGRAIDHEVLVATRKSAEAENRFKLATTLKNSNQPAQAAKEFQRVIQLHGESSLAHNELGVALVALVALGQVEKATEHYRRALEIDPNFATAYYNLGNRYWDRGDDEEAKRLYEKAIEIKPNYVDALRNLGLMLSDEGEFSEAQALYEKIIEIDPHDAMAHNTLGQLLRAQRIEFQRALELHQHAVLLDPDFGDAHRNLGILLAASGNVQQAAVHFERAVELNPGDELAKKIW